MKTIITREVLDTLDAVFPYPKRIIRNVPKVEGGWEIDIPDDLHQWALSIRAEGESISDILVRALRHVGRAGFRRSINRDDRKRARQRANRRATGL